MGPQDRVLAGEVLGRGLIRHDCVLIERGNLSQTRTQGEATEDGGHQFMGLSGGRQAERNPETGLGLPGRVSANASPAGPGARWVSYLKLPKVVY